MPDAAAAVSEDVATVTPIPLWRKILRRNRAAQAGLGLVILFSLLSLAGDALAPFDYREQRQEWNRRAPSGEHWLGTDDLGRDVMSRLLHGARFSLVIGMLSVALAVAIGIPLGLASGFFGGALDFWSMRLVDLMLAFPGILLAIAIMAVVGPSFGSVIVAVGVVNVPLFIRQVRASALSLREREFVLASRALGAGPARQMARHILPNAMGPVIVLATLGMGTAILEAAALGFIGLGVGPGHPEWGNMLAENRRYLLQAPWLVLAPGIAITLVVMGFNLFGDALRDALDPRSVVE